MADGRQKTCPSIKGAKPEERNSLFKLYSALLCIKCTTAFISDLIYNPANKKMKANNPSISMEKCLFCKTQLKHIFWSPQAYDNYYSGYPIFKRDIFLQTTNSSFWKGAKTKVNELLNLATVLKLAKVS